MTSYGVDTNCYMDSGATDHITNDHNKLTICDKDNGHEQVHAAGGTGMDINHIGHLNITTSDRIYILKTFCMFLKQAKILLSANRLFVDNNSFV